MIERFITQLKLIEKNVSQAKIDLDEFDPVTEIGDVFYPIINLKFHEFYLENGIPPEETDNEYFNEDMNEFARKAIEVNSIYRKLSENLHVEYNEDGNAAMTCTIPGMLDFFLEKKSNGENSTFLRERELILKTSVISLCTNLETLASWMMTQFFLFIDNGSTLDKKNLSFKELNEIGSIEDARRYLIDDELDGIFRKSFKDWFEIINGKFNISREFKDEGWNIEEINELYQRRNLFIHTDGVVNDFYLKKCDKELIGNLKKGDQISASPEYILNKIKIIERLAWLMYYKFCQARYSQDIEELFINVNNTMLPHMRRNCDAISEIWKSMFNNKKIQDESVIIAKINYFLYYRINDRLTEVEKDLENFNTSHYANHYVMAKSIILGRDCFIEVKNYINSIDENEFFSSLDWPLFSLIKNDPRYKPIFEERLDVIFKGGNGSEYVIIDKDNKEEVLEEDLVNEN
ncbi:hypothetical protein [Jeotgalibaca dankookensis]|uniref:hypothetical protein n=1 Tax=Jeotgalibaca dankookensis TaxID=708126 RepID=UPI00078062E7|nr:hypothetical protein [Jeotgalibaca dankookensis]